MVEVVGFEPTIFWSQTRRDTKLRYTSTLGMTLYRRICASAKGSHEFSEF